MEGQRTHKASDRYSEPNEHHVGATCVAVGVADLGGGSGHILRKPDQCHHVTLFQPYFVAQGERHVVSCDLSYHHTSHERLLLQFPEGNSGGS